MFFIWNIYNYSYNILLILKILLWLYKQYYKLIYMTGILHKYRIVFSYIYICLTFGPYMEIIYMCDSLKSFFEKPQVGLDKIHVCLFGFFFLLFSVIHTLSRESNWKALHSCVELARRAREVVDGGVRKKAQYNLLRCQNEQNYLRILSRHFVAVPAHQRRVRLPRRIL